MADGVLEQPTTRLRWNEKFDGKSKRVRVLEQLWHITDCREGKYHVKEQWREVPDATN